MPDGSIRTPNDARTIEAGMLLIGAGALLLLVSLFLEWYEPGAEAWDVFEVWDLVLAGFAIIALVAVASRMGVGAARPSSWLIVPAIGALVIVLYVLIDPPPAVPPISDPSTGLWLALAAAILMTAGALLSVARISVAINPADALGGGHGSHGGADQRGGLFGRRRADPVDHDPAAPGPGPDLGAGPGPGPGRPGDTPPTEPTRRI